MMIRYAKKMILWSICSMLLFLMMCASVATTKIRFPDTVIKRQAATASANEWISQSHPTVDNNTAANRITTFTIKLNRILDESPNENNVFSPISISAALTLLLLGSAGRTLEELKAVLNLNPALHYDQLQFIHQQFGAVLNEIRSLQLQPSHDIQIATALFIQSDYPIKPNFRYQSQTLYGSDLISVDFERNSELARSIMDEWVKQRTRGKIHTLLQEPPVPNTRIILGSAMYFKALWEFPFFEEGTRIRDFYPHGRKHKESAVRVDMMANGGWFPYHRSQELKCEIMGLPYKGNQTTMYIVIPFQSSTATLKQFSRDFDAMKLEHLVDNARYTKSVIVFPRMHIESVTDLKQSLYRMGLRTLFDPKQSDLRELSDSDNRNDDTQLPSFDLQEMLFFTRLRDRSQCAEMFKYRPDMSLSECMEMVREGTVQYKRFENGEIGRRISRSEKSVRHEPLYADSILHKVYMDITESGTEAAAVTSVTLARDGGSIPFRVDVPFLFFIRHAATKTILFWGSVTKPEPFYV